MGSEATPRRRSHRRGVLLTAGLAALGALATGCTPDAGMDEPDHPLGLVPCGDAPYVAVFAGQTERHLAHELPGSTPSSDVYGLRADGTVEQVTDDYGTYEAVLSPDASTIYAAGRPVPHGETEQLVAIDVSTGARELLAEGAAFAAPAAVGELPGLALIAWTGRTADGAADPVPARLDPEGSRGLEPLTSPWSTPGGWYDAAWSPSGRLLAYLTGSPPLTPEVDQVAEVVVLDVQSGAVEVVASWRGGPSPQYLDWSPDESRLVTTVTTPLAPGRFARDVVEVDLATGERATLREDNGERHVYASRDGAALLTLRQPQEDATDAVLVRLLARADDGTAVTVRELPLALGEGVDEGADERVVGALDLAVADCALP
ncbi:hypothetical protein [Actinotalea solisilvae]|uniref:hypothetical protein n=1 Tax=Actinotalea solisilvae TaxID=2072922 RepID=UPI0018F1D97F|nr:hypothetical protein [Actinotalea solisilvae]